MKITVLIENTAPEGSGLAFEHGLSLLLNYKDKTILLDTGSSGDFADNAEKLGVDLKAVDFGVLSHGHYDHGDGLRRFFRENETAPFYIRQGADAPLFSVDDRGVRYIGVHREIWEESGSRFRPTSGKFSLGDGLWLTSCTHRDPAFTGRAVNLVYKRGEDDFVPDDYRHEQSLVCETEKGLIVFNSCSHAGVVNIIRDVLADFPGQQVYAMVGGLHMFGRGESGMNCTPDYVFSVADELKKLGVTEIHTGHCTGEPALALMRQRFGEGCTALTGGQVFSF